MAAGSRAQDERRTKRYNVRNFELCCTQRGFLSGLLGKRIGGALPVVNFSLSGAQFLSGKRFPPGEKLRVHLRTAGSNESVELGAQVRWCQQIPRRGAFRVGVEFAEMPGAHLMRLREIETVLGGLNIRLLCPNCRSTLSVKKKYEGTLATCPRCRAPIDVTEPEDLPELESEKSSPKAVATEASTVPAGGGLAGSFAMFLRTTVRSRLHLDIIQSFSKGERNQILGSADVAKQTGVPEERIRVVLRELVNRGVLKEIGVKTFNYDPIPAVRKHLAELAGALLLPHRRAEVLAVVLEAEKKAT